MSSTNNMWKSTVAQITGPKLSGPTTTALLWAGAGKGSAKIIKRTYNSGNFSSTPLTLANYRDRMPISHKINPENRKKIPRKKKNQNKKKHEDGGDDATGRRASRYPSAYGGSHTTAVSDDEAYYDTDLEDEDPSYDHVLRDKTIYYQACKTFDVIPSSYFMKNMGKFDVIMNYQGIGDIGIAAMCVPLMNNYTITTLELAGNAITNEGLEYMREMFRENIFIRDLSLAENPLRSEGAKTVTEIMKINNQITKLDISGCGFTEKDAIHIADMLNNTTTLEHLIMRNNEFGDKGGVILGPAIGANDSIQIMDLSWNHLRLRGAAAIADSLRENNTLKTLNVSWNGFSADGAKALGDALAENETIQEVDVSSNRLNMQAVVNLMCGVKQNKSLRRLKLSRNPMTTKGSLHVLETLKAWEDMTLRRLELYNVQMDDKDVTACLEEVQALHPSLVIRRGVPSKYDDGKPKIRLGHQENPMEVLLTFIKKRDINIIDLFKQFDVDNSWSVSRDEFKMGIKLAKIPLSEDQVVNLMDKLDADGDGEIDFGELMKGQKEFEEKQLAKSKPRTELSRQSSIVDHALVNLNQTIAQKYKL